MSYSEFAHNWFSCFRIPLYDSFINDSINISEHKDKYVAVIEYADKNDDVYVEYSKKHRHLINCCRIFKQSNIGFSQSFSSYNSDSHCFTEHYHNMVPSAFFMNNKDKFSLSDNEKTEFANFFQDTYSYFPYTAEELRGTSCKKSKSILPRMFEIFHQSFSIADISTATMLRTIALEMLIK